ncbi:uroporphyrinogen-III C-methyltransferase [Planctomycetota bacterium]|nr:uroporphyrinogen-III C-methyltransferase [Planctomycetota bacterium]
MTSELNKETGVVTLVGAGPGDPDLLTVGAVRALSRADVVVFDHLICPEILGLAPNARLIPVGKKPYGERVEQETIHSILVREGSLGRDVVRLKGGDPFVFGRGTEEVKLLERAGVPFRIIPGVSSLNGVFGPAGVALTERGRNQGFAVFSATPATGSVEIAAWAKVPGPVVVFMGVHRAQVLASEFMQQRDADTPVVVIARGGTPREYVLETTLEELSDALANASSWTPAIIGIGLTRNAAFKKRPLDGCVAITTEPLDSSSADRLRALGARPAHAIDTTQSGEGLHPFSRQVDCTHEGTWLQS